MMHWMKDSEKNRRVILAIIITLKILLMGFFSSDYQDKMFIPFVDCFLSGENPYTYYYENDLMSSFPYFPLMLLIESVGGALIGIGDPFSVFFQNLLFKLPLMGFDIAGYYFIRKLGVRFKYAVVFYFCSPIILYSVYMHGQLDIIPTTLLMISVYHLVNWKQKNNLLWYAIFLGLALSTKFHIIAAVPVLFLYVVKKKNYIYALKYLGITAMIAIGFTIGFWGQGFIETVIFNKEQSVLFSISLDYETTQIIIPILAVMLLYLNVFELNYFNKNLLISMLGMLFSVFLVCIPPMPAWFVWIVPFFALYFGFLEEEKYKIMWIYMWFNLLYVVYFIFLHQTEFVDLYFLRTSLQGFKAEYTVLKSIVFTIMTACFILNIYQIYRFGIASNRMYKRRNVPFTIGIAGDSGTGKSKMLEKIQMLFGSGKDILLLEGDGDHKWERGDKNWENYTALNPQANHLYRQAEDIKRLRGGNSVLRSEYDHDMGLFTEKRRINTRKFIVLSGLHSLYLPQLRKELDLKIYMDTDPELRKYWKIQRDKHDRGYTEEQVLCQIEKRIPDAEKYIYPQKEYADLVISYFDKTLKHCTEEKHDIILSVKLTVGIDWDLENMIHSFYKYGIHPQKKLCDDFTHQEIIFDGEELMGKNMDFDEILEWNIPQYEDVLSYVPKWEKDAGGVVQLFLLLMISEKMRG